jgi:hypothetical protein
VQHSWELDREAPCLLLNRASPPILAESVAASFAAISAGVLNINAAPGCSLPLVTARLQADVATVVKHWQHKGIRCGSSVALEIDW